VNVQTPLRTILTFPRGVECQKSRFPIMLLEQRGKIYIIILITASAAAPFMTATVSPTETRGKINIKPFVGTAKAAARQINKACQINCGNKFAC
jgi:hypothetical protein